MVQTGHVEHYMSSYIARIIIVNDILLQITYPRAAGKEYHRDRQILGEIPLIYWRACDNSCISHTKIFLNVVLQM